MEAARSSRGVLGSVYVLEIVIFITPLIVIKAASSLSISSLIIRYIIRAVIRAFTLFAACVLLLASWSFLFSPPVTAPLLGLLSVV